MRKENPHHRWRLSNEECKQIRQMTRAGRSEKEIARSLGVHRNTIYRFWRKSGLSLLRPSQRCPELTPKQESQILQLKRDRGLGADPIAEKLHLRQWAVRKALFRNGFRRSSKWASVDDTVRDKILAEIRERRNYLTDIAFKFGFGRHAIAKVAHAELRCPCFRGGTGEPLSSNFPVKDFRRKVKPGNVV